MQDLCFREPRGSPVLPIPAPAHLRPLEPSFKKGEVLCRKAKGALALGQGQKRHHRAALKAARGQRKEPPKPSQERRLRLALAVGDAVGQRQRELWPAENRFDEGGVMINVRNHHHHILRLERAVRLEGFDQGVVERLDFPQGAGAREKA